MSPFFTTFSTHCVSSSQNLMQQAKNLKAQLTHHLNGKVLNPLAREFKVIRDFSYVHCSQAQSWSKKQALWTRAEVLSGTDKTVAFIQSNWETLILYVIAWGLIVGLSGLMYGFETVSLPMTIGLGSGIFIGALTGIITYKQIDPRIDPTGQKRGQNSFWNLISKGLSILDNNGTRNMVISVAVTVILAASVNLPVTAGLLLGIIIGNQLAVKIAYQQNLGVSPESRRRTEIEEMADQIDTLSLQLDNCRTKIRGMQENVGTDVTEDPLSEEEEPSESDNP